MCDLETWFKFIPRAQYKPHYMSGNCYVGDFQSSEVSWKVDQLQEDHFVFRAIQKSSWQEKLAEEFGVERDDQFVQGTFHSSEDMITMAKRILELSEERL